MTRICLHCQKEFSDYEDECPRCHACWYRQKPKRQRSFKNKLSRFGKYTSKGFIQLILILLPISILIAIVLGGGALLYTLDNSHSSNNAQSQSYNNPSTAQSQSYNNPSTAQSQSYNNPISISAFYITESDLAKLNYKFSTEKLEFRYCLFGESYKNGVLITNMVEPEYQSRSQSSLLATECPSTSVGFIHSHPGDDGCILSSGDISTLNSEHFSIQGVICEKNRITIFTKDKPKNFIPIYAVSTNSNNVISSRDITPRTACVGERFCDGTCWNGCNTGGVWSCTPQGGHCQYGPDPKHCPPDFPNSCLGTCWDGCRAGGVWSCTSQGGHCQY